MNHLTVDEILDFVSLSELSIEAVELSAAVNGHIRNCDNCLKLVQSFQMIYDEFLCLNCKCSFKDFVLENCEELEIENKFSVDVTGILRKIMR